MEVNTYGPCGQFGNLISAQLFGVWLQGSGMRFSCRIPFFFFVILVSIFSCLMEIKRNPLTQSNIYTLKCNTSKFIGESY